jgi:hypothetical protein
MSSQEEYTSSLSASASIEGSFLFSFSASVDYNEMSSSLSNSETSFVESDAKCNIHDLKIKLYDQPPWSKDLNAALDFLLNSKNNEDYYDFYREFGTHVTIGVKLGSSFRYIFEMKKSSVEKMNSSGLSLSVAASGWGVSGSASTDH